MTRDWAQLRRLTSTNMSGSLALYTKQLTRTHQVDIQLPISCSRHGRPSSAITLHGDLSSISHSASTGYSMQWHAVNATPTITSRSPQCIFFYVLNIRLPLYACPDTAPGVFAT